MDSGEPAAETQADGSPDPSCLTPGPGAVIQEKSLETAAEKEGVSVCQFFLKGKCRFGDRCRLSHSDSSRDNPETGLLEQDDEEGWEKVQKTKRRSDKANKIPKHENTDGKAKSKSKSKEVCKKPRMRTADDVISRILWDPSVESSDFVVGYVDRFLGVLERPFSEFNWDTDPCDCDYSAELALPRHRIQYFTYRGHRVWDRNSRTDRVFGSTGQSLAPPFGGEEEVEGVRTHDAEPPAMVSEDPVETPQVAGGGRVESETAESSRSENTPLDEMNVNTSLTTRTDLNDAESTSEEREGGGESKPAMDNRLLTSTDQISLSEREGWTEVGGCQEEALEEWKDSWEGNEKQNHPDQPGGDQWPSTSPEQREKRGARPPRRSPTHFITFRANTPAILSGFQRLQDEVVSLLPSSAPYWVASSTLHVTLCLLLLSGPAEVAAAGEILRRFARLDRNPPVAVSFPLKLKHFGGRVLHLSPQPQLPLQQLNSGLQEAYREEGWLHRHSFNPRYHLTLAKVGHGEGERIFEGVGELKVGKGVSFGRLPVNTLNLCEMGVSKTDGFYKILCTVTLR